jgi:hypothetical protein
LSSAVLLPLAAAMLRICEAGSSVLLVEPPPLPLSRVCGRLVLLLLPAALATASPPSSCCCSFRSLSALATMLLLVADIAVPGLLLLGVAGLPAAAAPAFTRPISGQPKSHSLTPKAGC